MGSLGEFYGSASFGERVELESYDRICCQRQDITVKAAVISNLPVGIFLKMEFVGKTTCTCNLAEHTQNECNSDDNYNKWHKLYSSDTPVYRYLSVTNKLCCTPCQDAAYPEKCECKTPKCSGPYATPNIGSITGEEIGCEWRNEKTVDFAGQVGSDLEYNVKYQVKLFVNEMKQHMLGCPDCKPEL